MEAPGDRPTSKIQPRVPSGSGWEWVLGLGYVVGVLWVMQCFGVGPIGATNYLVAASSDPELGYGFVSLAVLAQCIAVGWALHRARRQGLIGRTAWLLVAAFLPVACTVSLHEKHADFPGPQATAAERRAWADRTFGAWYATAALAVSEDQVVRQAVGEPVQLDIAQGDNRARPRWEARDGKPRRLGAGGEFTFAVSGPRGAAMAEVRFTHQTAEPLRMPPRWGQRIPGALHVTGQLVRNGAPPVPLSERTFGVDKPPKGK